MPDIRTTPVLEDCQRANEDPLTFGGRWRPASGGPSNWNFYGGLQLFNGAIMDTGTIPNATSVSYWTPRSFAYRVECWARSGPGFDLTEGWRLFLNLTLPELHPQMQGYELQITSNIGGNTWTIAAFRPAKVDLASVEGTPLAENELALFRYDAGAISAWRDNATDGVAWSQIITATDSASPFGYLGLGIDQDDNNPSWREFGGGELRRRTQIYRWLPRTKILIPGEDPLTPVTA